MKQKILFTEDDIIARNDLRKSLQEKIDKQSDNLKSLTPNEIELYKLQVEIK